MLRKTMLMAAFPLLLLGLPLAGAALRGIPLYHYLQFPPRTGMVSQPGFSLGAFLVIAFIAGLFTAPFIIRHLAALCHRPKRGRTEPRRFPWWGWAALAGLAGAWILAWNRFPWFLPWQRLTFFPLWFFFIITINAWVIHRQGKSPMTAHRGRFLLLFPLSALFWWFFEYLNRFTQNWFYQGTGDLTPWQYGVEATLAFSTVLPAVVSLRALILTFPSLQRGFSDAWRLPFIGTTRFYALLFLFAIAGLFGAGALPVVAFPFMWVSPLFLWVVLQRLRGKESRLMQDIRGGDWRLLYGSALAALVAGFFWEMWNYWSLARWVYTVPFVQVLPLFEMPLLGYTGYIPFGVECAVIAEEVDM